MSKDKRHKKSKEERDQSGSGKHMKGLTPKMMKANKKVNKKMHE